jgi:hypothetical protein
VYSYPLSTKKVRGPVIDPSTISFPKKREVAFLNTCPKRGNPRKNSEKYPCYSPKLQLIPKSRKSKKVVKKVF